MPYAVKKQGSKWVCYNADTGKVYGEHATKADAEKQQAALYASTGGRAAVWEFGGFTPSEFE